MVLQLAAATLFVAAIAVPARAAEADAVPLDTMQARVLACAACHGPQGEGINNDYFPRLAGKPARYV